MSKDTMRSKPIQPIRPGRAVRTVVLWHQTSGDSHFDWMFEDPQAAPGSGRLVTFRLPLPPRDWGGGRAIVCERLADHRRAYLTYEGPISEGRGQVRRVDEGRAIVHQHTIDGYDVTLGTCHFAGRVRIGRLGPSTWRITTLDR